MLSSMVNRDKFDEKTCIIFASYKDAKTLTINQVSSNFSNLFCFTSRDHIYDKNIESIIPLAFQSVHKMYIKQYLEDSITCDISSINTDQQLQQNEQDNENDSNEVTPDNQAQNYQFNQLKYLSEKQTGIKNQNYELQNCKMNQQIIFASLNQMFILPIKIDIRTNEYKENGTFGLVAKIKKINEKYQYILFNETDLGVVGLTKQMHELFFPNFNNLQKINLRQIFPFLIDTQNQTKIEDSQVQNNERICNSTNIKNQFHVNLTDEMQQILSGQSKNKLKIKKKLSFIVIQHSDDKNNTLNSSCNNIKRLYKAKSQKEISSYSFNYVQLFVRKLKYKGVNNLSYVEIVKIRQLNPAKQAQIILKEITKVKKQYIYSQLFENPIELQNIISDLELNNNNNSQLQFNSFHTQLQQSSRNYNYGNQLHLINENDTPIDFAQVDFYKQYQLTNKQQTQSDESTNLEQIKMMSYRIGQEDLNCQSDGGSSLTLNKFKEQKELQKLNEIMQFNQLYQLQNNNSQEKKLIQQNQGNQVCNSDLQIKVDFPNKNLNFQNLQEDQLKTSSYYALASPGKLNKTINLELTPNNSYFMNINSNQQSLTLFSDQNFNVQQTKQNECISNKTQENIYLDVETSNLEIYKKQNTAISPLKISKNPSKIFISNNFREKKVNNTLINALSNTEKKQFMKNSYQHNHYNQQNKNIKKQQVQDIIYDIASSNSQNSYYTPVKSQLQHIMEDQSTLQVIKLIKMIGIICFSIMICITFIQFNSMQQYLQQANQDYKDFSWPTTYSSSLSDILKYKNIQYLVNNTNIKFPDINQQQIFYNQMQQNMENTFSNVLRLLTQMEMANSQRTVFNRVIENQIVFHFEQLYDPQLLNQITSDTQLISINYTTNLQYSILLNVQNIFHYIHNLSNGRPEYYLIQNQLEQISQLKKLQQEIEQSQSQQQEYIQGCVAIIIPLYYYIQKERDSIIYLFTTFPIQKLDILIKNIQNSYLSTNTSSIYQNQDNQIILDTIVQLQSIDNQKNIRKQSISSITSLPRYNKKLLFACFFIYAFIICYPIIVQILTTDYLAKSAVDLQTIQKVYYLRSYLLQNIAIHFNIIVMKAKPGFKRMQPEMYYDYLQTLISQYEDISKDIQWIINSQYSDQRFNQNLYDSFFFSAFKTNLCENFMNYPQFNTNPKKINIGFCASSQEELLQNGFQVAYKSLFINLFTDLYNIYQITDKNKQFEQIRQILGNFDIQEFTDFSEFLDETIIIDCIDSFLNGVNAFNLLFGLDYFQQLYE
ncbi:transmembrane protein, putative (macronuclear) [Tetrahymena thermophila SB210]|uniref:Transmembrane protein, putative n=1 Tax=Tetrahymena thermophila (strain SB210) TaxID=312017 RepID=Q23QJ3_TETTS|nr:transmembrane protein, putative [Tetrahymena thermophila SB210]EAR98895.2 transmembrane protein, putative [Tetrahymena thermophila SB210]|eukprot:XP_001019140.2 transmembrane protein, putative [Tetrahymena thermophila SB210]